MKRKREDEESGDDENEENTISDALANLQEKVSLRFILIVNILGRDCTSIVQQYCPIMFRQNTDNEPSEAYELPLHQIYWGIGQGGDASRNEIVDFMRNTKKEYEVRLHPGRDDELFRNTVKLHEKIAGNIDKYLHQGVDGGYLVCSL